LHGEVLVARVFLGLPQERLAHGGDDVVGRPAGRADDLAEIDELVAEETELELTRRRQAHAVAARAEGIRLRRDDADLARSSRVRREPVVARGAVVEAPGLERDRLELAELLLDRRESFGGAEVVLALGETAVVE